MRIVWTMAALGSLLGVATPALADRAPTASERTAIERVLRQAGFVSWEQIELDDDGPRWEVDDARTRASVRYDVKIDPRTLRIVKRERDD